MDLRKNGQTSNIIRVALKNSSTGAALTGLSFSSTGLIISTIANNESSPTVYSVASSNVEDITTLGTFAAPTSSKCRFKEVSSTNHPGLYEIQIADARFAVSNAKKLVISLSGATNLLATDYEVLLASVDFFDAVRFGLTALPNAAAEASGGLYTRGTGAGQINQAANGQVDTNVVYWKGSTAPAMTGDAFARLGAPAGASVSADVAAVKTKTDSLTFTVAGQVDANALAISGSTDAADNLERSTLAIAVGTVGSSSTTTSIVTSSITPSASVTDQFKGRIVTFDKNTTTAALKGQATDITGSSSGGVLTVTALTTQPVSGDTFTIT